MHKDMQDDECVTFSLMLPQTSIHHDLYFLSYHSRQCHCRRQYSCCRRPTRRWQDASVYSKASYSRFVATTPMKPSFREVPCCWSVMTIVLSSRSSKTCSASATAISECPTATRTFDTNGKYMLLTKERFGLLRLKRHLFCS